jgi:hypothetical protein
VPRVPAPSDAHSAAGAARQQIKVCVVEFNKVDRKHKLKRVMRATEFKDKFTGFNMTLKCALHALRPAARLRARV